MRLYSARRRSGRGGGALFFLFLAAGAILVLLAAGIYLKPLLSNMAVAKVSNSVTRAINETVTDELNEGEISYEKLISFEKDSDGKITALRSNMAEINRLQSGIVIALVERISETNTADLNIPIGNLTGISLLSGRGFRIPVRILSVSSATASFANQFTSAGINQTRHQIILNIKVQISILVPGFSTSATVEQQMNVAETVIVGSVPESYTFFSGVEDAQQAIEDYFNLQ
nr:sporulation protein YunB [Papillibacter cinnamivorans]